MILALINGTIRCCILYNKPFLTSQSFVLWSSTEITQSKLLMLHQGAHTVLYLYYNLIYKQLWLYLLYVEAGRKYLR